MATVFETKLIGNIGKDASVRNMDKGIVAINFPVAHNRNWRDKRTGEQRTKTTWVNCTIWKRDGANMRIVDFLKKGTLVEITGTPVAKGYLNDDKSVRTEIRLNVAKTNILRTPNNLKEENTDQGNAYNEDEASAYSDEKELAAFEQEIF
ncbi:MAG: single-stranded DNA-binding protein [Crocinitomicaceae bacterium]|nr:single-stranded DNA-binding protein [Crocinitomicaceae bacterium]